MNSIVLGPFLPDDYEAALALWRRTPGMGLSAADERPRILGFLDRNPGLSFVARAASARAEGRARGPIVGTVLAGTDGRRGYLYHLAVDPEYRRLGLGTSLTARALAALRNVGIDKCHLMLVQGNELGGAFWTSLGWTLRDDILLFSHEIGEPTSV